MTRLAERIAVAVVCRLGANGESQYLVGMRRADQTLAGCHEFPGGRMRLDESAFAAAVRECREETGIEVFADQKLCVVQHEYEFGLVELNFVLCSPQHDVLPYPPFDWLPASRLEIDQFPAANHQLLTLLKDMQQPK